MKKLTLAFAIFINSITASALYAADYKFTSLDWPPYTEEKAADQGSVTKALKQALAKSSHNLSVTFTPWERTVNTAKTDAAYVGYYPEYYSAEIEKDFYFSKPIGTSDVVFAQMADKPITWKSLEDIAALGTVGVVSGYVNEEKFDQWVEQGKIKADKATSDLANLKKLVAGRIKAAVIDKNVMDYLIKTTPELKGMEGKIVANDKVLKVHNLHICLKKTHPEASKLLEQINAAIP